MAINENAQREFQELIEKNKKVSNSLNKKELMSSFQGSTF